jgi:hypothetical protein
MQLTEKQANISIKLKVGVWDQIHENLLLV